MPEKPKEFSGLILDRAVSGEKFWRVVVLTREHGAQTCMVRIAGKNKTTCVPDLFDEAEILLDKPKAGADDAPRFAKEYRILRRNSGISGNYAALVCASKLAFALAHNAFPADANEAVFTLCGNAFRAFAEKPNAEAAYLKALWKFARETGYPVREDWFENSRADDRESVAEILKTPLDALEADPREVARQTRRLEIWLEQEHHFVFG